MDKTGERYSSCSLWKVMTANGYPIVHIIYIKFLYYKRFSYIIYSYLYIKHILVDMCNVYTQKL